MSDIVVSTYKVTGYFTGFKKSENIKREEKK